MARITRTPKQPCPACGTLLDSASDMESDAVPEPNDVSVCLRCGVPLVFNQDMSLRRMTTDEVDELAEKDPEALHDLRRNIQAVMALRGRTR